MVYTYLNDKPNVPLIVILIAGRPMSVTANITGTGVPGAGTPHFDSWDAFIVGWLPGTQTGTAMASILFGDKEFIGKSPYTWRTSFATVEGALNTGSYPASSAPIYKYGHGLTKTGTPCTCGGPYCL